MKQFEEKAKEWLNDNFTEINEVHVYNLVTLLKEQDQETRDYYIELVKSEMKETDKKIAKLSKEYSTLKDVTADLQERVNNSRF